MNQDGQIFRKAALDRLSSPEEIDQLMTLVTAKEWLAGSALALLVVGACVWSFVGSLPTTVEGSGILLRTGGVLDVVSLADGQITSIDVDVGDQIKTGQVVARIAQPELRKEIDETKARLAELKFHHSDLSRFGSETSELRKAKAAQQRSAMSGNIREARSHLKFLREKLKTQRELLRKGLITTEGLQHTKEEIDQANRDVRAARTRLKEASVDQLEHESRLSSDLRTSELRISDTERKLETLEERFDSNSAIVSPYDGRVLELRANRGEMVSRGVAILNLDPITDPTTPQNLELVVYVPYGEGKLVQPGMEVQVAPATVKKEEFGFAVGEVTFVSEFPATRRGMMRVLDNEVLVQSFMKTEPPLTIRARMIKDPSTFSGYKWSSNEGPPIQLTTGTPCSASITVDEQPPITKAIPALTKLLSDG